VAIAISSITTATNDGTSATISVTTSESPTATQVGDFVVVVHSNDFYTLAAMPTPTATGSPTLTNIVDADGGTNQGHIRCWWYRANTGGAQTVSVTETGAHDEEKFMAVYVLTGVDTGASPIDGTPASNSSSTQQTSQVCNSVTVTNTDSYAIQALAAGSGVAAPSYTAPGGTTKQYDQHVGGGSHGGGTKQLSASGATGSFTWTIPPSGTPYASATFAIKTATAATSIPYNPQRTTQVRDYGESYWIQKDRRNANLVATAANDLDVPLLLPEHQWQQYRVSDFISRRLVPQQPNRVGDMSLFATAANDLAMPLLQPVEPRYDVTTRLRGTWPQQRERESDPSLLSPVVAMDPPAAQRYIPPRDYGEVQWHQTPARDPSLLTTALLENELLGGAETAKRTNLPATHAARWWMPQQPQREAYSPGLLDTALLEGPLLGAADDLARHRTWFVDRREVPQQREYFDLSLLLTALLEGPLVWVRPPQYQTDRRVTVQMPRLPDPALLVPPTDPITLVGVGGDLWRRYNTPATHVDRRQTVRERPRWTVYMSVDLGVGANPPIVSTTPSGANVSQSGTGSTQQTVGVAFVSQDGVVIVSQTTGGVL
jgi:hypothetical protein